MFALATLKLLPVVAKDLKITKIIQTCSSFYVSACIYVLKDLKGRRVTYPCSLVK